VLPPEPTLPPHIEDSIAAISEVHAQQWRQTRPVQKAVATVMEAIARPAFVGVLTIVVAAWIGINLGLQANGRHAPDPAPFTYLSEVVSLAALYLTATILITQKHDDRLATQREQLTLQLAMLNEQKSAKIIHLLEEIRRNDPDQSSHADDEAEAMAVAVDPQAVLEKIRTINQASGEKST
jgi:uncharacterized membrane protein